VAERRAAASARSDVGWLLLLEFRMPYADPVQRLERKRREYRRNPEIFRERVQRFKFLHKQQVRAYGRSYSKTENGRKRCRARLRRRDQAGCLMLTDRYIRCLLSKHTSVKRSAWPQMLVEAKRAELKLRRKLNECCQTTGNVG